MLINRQQRRRRQKPGCGHDSVIHERFRPITGVAAEIVQSRGSIEPPQGPDALGHCPATGEQIGREADSLHRQGIRPAVRIHVCLPIIH